MNECCTSRLHQLIIMLLYVVGHTWLKQTPSNLCWSAGPLPWWPHAAGVTRVTPTVPGRVKPFTSHHRPLSFPQLAAAFAVGQPTRSKAIKQKPISLNKSTQNCDIDGSFKSEDIKYVVKMNYPPSPQLIKTQQQHRPDLTIFTDYINFPYCSINLNANGAKALSYWSQAFISKGNAVTWQTWVVRWKEAREVWQQKSPHIGRWPRTSTAESSWLASVGQVMTVCRASLVPAHEHKNIVLLK